MGNTVAPNTINVFMTIRHPKFKKYMNNSQFVEY